MESCEAGRMVAMYDDNHWRRDRLGWSTLHVRLAVARIIWIWIMQVPDRVDSTGMYQVDYDVTVHTDQIPVPRCTWNIICHDTSWTYEDDPRSPLTSQLYRTHGATAARIHARSKLLGCTGSFHSSDCTTFREMANTTEAGRSETATRLDPE